MRPSAERPGIVAGFDGTDASRCAVRWAAARADVRSCPLHVVRVLESPVITGGGWTPVAAYTDSPQRTYAEAELRAEIEVCRARLPELDVRWTLHRGGACARLANRAHRMDADMIVVGASDRGPLARFVLGSTSRELLRVAGRPVVSVRDATPVQQASSLIGLSPVVVGLDGLYDPVACGRALDLAFDVAAQDDVPVTIILPGAYRPDGVAVADPGLDRLERFVGPWRRLHPTVPVTTYTARGRAEPELVASSEDAHLLVVGRHGRGRPLARTVLRQARCTVAVVGR